MDARRSEGPSSVGPPAGDRHDGEPYGRAGANQEGGCGGGRACELERTPKAGP